MFYVATDPYELCAICFANEAELQGLSNELGTSPPEKIEIINI